MRFRLLSSERGYSLLLVVVITAVLLVAGVAAIRLTRFELRATALQTAHSQAFYVAEAGIQRAVAQLAWDRAFASSFTTYRYPSSGTVSESYGGGSYQFSIVQDPNEPTDSRRKLVTAVGNRLGQAAEIVAHVSVQPVSSSVSLTPTPTAGFRSTPTPGATPTATPTPNEGSPFLRPCDDGELLVSYDGTAKLINTVAAASQLFNGNIFSNEDVTFQFDAAATANASGTVRAGGDFVNAGLALNALSNFSGATLSYEETYQASPFDTVGHLVCSVVIPLVGPVNVCFGVHFAGADPRHGTDVGPGGIPDARQWIPDWERMRRGATYVVTRESQPFGSWDDASGTWVVGTENFAAGSADLYYIEGNVKITGLHLFRTASPTIAARGWISVRSLTVLAAGLLGSDVQNVNLVAEGDVGIGREILNMSTGVFETVNSSLLSGGTGIGLNLATLGSRMNLFGYSEKGEVFAMVGTAVAAARLRTCILAKEDATLARTAAALSTVRSLDSGS